MGGARVQVLLKASIYIGRLVNILRPGVCAEELNGFGARVALLFAAARAVLCLISYVRCAYTGECSTAGGCEPAEPSTDSLMALRREIFGSRREQIWSRNQN